jgi:FdrA protein
MMFLHALKALQEDEETKVIVAISKQPSKEVAETVLAKLTMVEKPAVVIFMGPEVKTTPSQKTSEVGEVYMADTLEEAALASAILSRNGILTSLQTELSLREEELKKQAKTLKSKLKTEQEYLRGLFSGGTLCEEAIRVWSQQVGPVWSNSPFDPTFKLADLNTSHEHCALDLGAEEFTIGRLHPMLDNDLRILRLAQEARDPTIALIQMDVVLGYGAHPDPASELGPAIEAARRTVKEENRELLVILSITGTNADPQDFERQHSTLEASGAIIMESNAAASQLAAWIAKP